MTTGNVDAEQLEELARRLDGETGDGGVSGELSSVFTRASNLGASGDLSALQSMPTWLSDTGPDLRNRAGYARLGSGDPTAGLRLAGYTNDELDAYDGVVPADALITLNTLAANGNADDDVFERQHRETIDEYLGRIAGHYGEMLPGLEGHGETIETIISDGADWFSLTSAGAVVANAGLSMWKAARWERYFVSAPGAWLPGQLGNYLRSSPTINRLLMIPGQTAARWEARIFGGAWDAARGSWLARTPLVGGITPNGVANFIVGNDRLANALNFRPGSDLAARVASRVPGGLRAAQTNMTWIGRNAYSGLRGLGATRWGASVGSVISTARATGALRFLGVGGGVLATGLSVANLVAQGNPVDAWNEADGAQEKAGYAADWVEVGFNASLTAAMVAPSPWTLGAAAVTGIVWGGLKVVEHWDDITEWSGDAWDATTEFTGDAVDAVTDVGGDLVDGAKDLVGDLF
jgi:hypothetical protein